MSINGSNMGLPGLSGYDFSGIVQKMADVYRLPGSKMVTEQNSLQVEKDAWRDIKTRLSALENSLTALSDTPTWTATKASSSSSDLLSVTSSPNAVKGLYNIKVIATAQAQTVVSNTINVSEATSATSVTAGSFSISIGETSKTIDVEAGESLSAIADTINNAKIGVSATVVKVDSGYKLTLIAKETGTENEATFAEVSGNVLDDLGILNNDTGTDVLNEKQAARDAQLTINGITDITSPTNKVTTAIPGLTLNLNSEDPNKTVTVKVEDDFSVAQNAIQKFVDQYNSVQDFIAGKMSYDKETKKTGDLFGDPILQGIQERLRNIVTGRLNNPTKPYLSLSDIGVGTSSTNFGKDAKLEFDTSKFIKAMETNPESVANLFGASVEGVNLNTETKDGVFAQGLANIMREYLHPMVMFQGSLDKMQDNYTEQIDDIKDRIIEFEEKAKAYEERTRLKFVKLESMLAEIGSQSAWLASQVNALSNFNNSNRK